MSAGAREMGEAVFAEFLRSFTSGTADDVAGLFTPDALFWGTRARELITTPAGIHRYFDTAFSRRARATASAVGAVTAVALSDDAVVVSGIWQVARVVEGEAVVSRNRNSVVIVRRGERWLIASFHNSPLPAE